MLSIVNMGMNSPGDKTVSNKTNISVNTVAVDTSARTEKKKTVSTDKDLTAKKTKKSDTDTSVQAEKKKTASTDKIRTTTKAKKADTDTDTCTEKKKTALKDTSLLSTTPKSYKINGVVHFNQYLEMPTGCEIVSARMVLSYYGVDLTYDDMLEHIERDDLKITKKGKLYGKTPFQAFIGNPRKTNGFGCYPPVIMQMIENYGFEKFYAESTCNLPLDFIAETYVTQDIPVLVWASIGMMQTSLTSSWNVEDEKGKPTNEKYTWRVNEHCLVLIGYDEKYYYFSDPLSYQKETKYERTLVEKRYEEVGRNSLIIREKE